MAQLRVTKLSIITIEHKRATHEFLWVVTRIKDSKFQRKIHSVSVHVVYMQSDSYGRHLAGLVQDMVTTDTLVSALLKPGVRMTSVIPIFSPHWHDLHLNQPINRQMRLVNRRIRHLTTKFASVELVDYNLINRLQFTRHGMQLRISEKRILARLVIESILRLYWFSPKW